MKIDGTKLFSLARQLREINNSIVEYENIVKDLRETAQSLSIQIMNEREINLSSLITEFDFIVQREVDKEVA